MCGQPVWKVGRCLRRHTSCQQRQKVCKKRRLNLRFKDPLARPVPFRPLGCVPHGWECFARGFKCRIIPAMALILQNIRCMFLMFSCRRGHRPLRKKYAPPTFHTVSGSGAGGETIQSLGHVLQISRLSTKKEVQKPYGFWRAFGYFSRVGKVPRRRQDKPIQLPFPPQKNRAGLRTPCSVHLMLQVKILNPSTTMPRTTSTIPVARLSVFGAALFANTAAIRAQRSVNTTHSASTVQSGAPPMAK